jgi:hypothetical protein
MVVQTVGLTWQQSFETAAVCAAAGGAAAFASDRRIRAVGAFLRELSVIAVLYGLWHLVGSITVSDTDDAFARARSIRAAERYLPLPSEHTMQKAVLGHPFLVHTANLYYAAMHLSTMGAFLGWLFVRHRDRYRSVRQVMAWTTLGCLLIQLVPVAPPRMLPGIVDTAAEYNESVYSSGFVADQLAAMPSVHVAWAVTIGYYVWRVSPSRWRWIGPLHAALMTVIVVITGNHWWLDGIVAVLVLVGCAWGVAGVRHLWRSVRDSRAAAADSGEVRPPVPVASTGPRSTGRR